MKGDASPRALARTLAAIRDRGIDVAATRLLVGDVSARRYFRVQRARESASAVLALYPPELLADCRRFGATTALLAEAGVRVPAILASDCTAGWMLVEDLGPENLYESPPTSPRRLEARLRQALGIRRRIAGIDGHRVAGLNPPLDGTLLSRELAICWECFLGRDSVAGAAPQRRLLERCLAELVEHLDAAPRLVCHRDFMARNLMPLADGLGVLDHQGLRLGPAPYDLASLCNDSLFPPPEMERRLLEPLLADESQRRTYSRCVVQRTLKAIGTFISFAAAGNERHLSLIGPSLARAATHLSRLPEGRALPAEISDRWRSLDIRSVRL